MLGHNSTPRSNQSQEKTHGKSTGLPRLPHSADAERALLGGIILGGDGPWLDASEFFLPFHQSLCRALTRLKREGKPVDNLVLISESLGPSELGNCGGLAYIAGLLDSLPKATNIEHYARIVREKAVHRRALAIAEQYSKAFLSANGNVGELVNELLEQAKMLSGHIGMEFGQKESSDPFRTAEDYLTRESTSAEFVAKPYVLAGAITDLVAKIKAGKTTYVFAEIVRPILDSKTSVVYLTEQPQASFLDTLRRAQLPGPENLRIVRFDQVSRMGWDSIAQLAIAKCQETSAPLLVVDTLPRFCGLEGERMILAPHSQP